MNHKVSQKTPLQTLALAIVVIVAIWFLLFFTIPFYFVIPAQSNNSIMSSIVSRLNFTAIGFVVLLVLLARKRVSERQFWEALFWYGFSWIIISCSGEWLAEYVHSQRDRTMIDTTSASLVATINVATIVGPYIIIFLIFRHVLSKQNSLTEISGADKGTDQTQPKINHNSEPELPASIKDIRNTETATQEHLVSDELRHAKGNEEMTQSSETPSWSEEFSILNEYDTVVKECHDELEGIDPKLAEQFREEIVADRKKAASIRDRLKTERDKKLNPYSSDELNAALAEARLMGPQAEAEFVRVVEVMGEDIDAEEIYNRIKAKFEVQSPPEEGEAELEHWGIIKNGDEYLVGDLKYGDKDAAIEYAKVKLDDYFQHAAKNTLKELLVLHGHNIQTNHFGHSRITSSDGVNYNVPDSELIRYVRAKVSPSAIREFKDYLSEK